MAAAATTRSDPWHCGRCARAADLGGHALEVGLVRLAAEPPEAPFRLGSEGVEDAVAAALAPCPCGGRLVPGRGAGEPLDARFDAAAAALFERGWSRLEAASEPALVRLRELWRPRALALLGRAGELPREDALRLKLEDRLAGFAQRIDEARAAGDDDAAEAAHARYIELGTIYVQRFLGGRREADDDAAG